MCEHKNIWLGYLSKLIICFPVLFTYQLSFCQNPYVRGAFPNDGARTVPCNTHITVGLHFPGEEGRLLDKQTLTNSYVKLYPENQPNKPVRSSLSYEEEFQYLTLRPGQALSPKTTYAFEINSGLTDERGNGFLPFLLVFKTGSCNEDEMLTSRGLEKEEVPKEEEDIAIADIQAMGGVLKEDTACIQWQTAQEKHLFSYVLEKSRDGISFDSIQEVLAAGYSDAPKDYFLMDRQTRPGRTTYRLRIKDNRGEQYFSKTVSVFRELIRFEKTRISMNDSLPISYKVPPRTSLVFVLRNARGDKIFQKAILLDNQKNAYTFDMRGVGPGKYMGYLITPKSRYRQRVDIVN